MERVRITSRPRRRFLIESLGSNVSAHLYAYPWLLFRPTTLKQE